jgi:hypothetical protein
VADIFLSRIWNILYSGFRLCYSQRLSVHLKWSVLSDLHGSNHYPLKINIATSHANWIIKETDWGNFTKSVSFDDRELSSIDSMDEHYTGAAEKLAIINTIINSNTV